jgi:hypothetical protein
MSPLQRYPNFLTNCVFPASNAFKNARSSSRRSGKARIEMDLPNTSSALFLVSSVRRRSAPKGQHRQPAFRRSSPHHRLADYRFARLRRADGKSVLVECLYARAVAVSGKQFAVHFALVLSRGTRTAIELNSGEQNPTESWRESESGILLARHEPMERL